MVKRAYFLLAGTILLLFLGSTCSNPTLMEADRQITYNVRVYPLPEHGVLRLSSNQVSDGSWVTIYANPDPGYILQKIILQRLGEGNPSSFDVAAPNYAVKISGDYSISAVFIQKTPGTSSVSVDRAVANGLIFPEKLNGTGGTTLRINVIPESGYDLVDGSLKVVSASDDRIIEAPASLPYTFTLPPNNEDVIIKAQFEPLPPQDLKSRASKYLSVGQYDIAATMYEAAWQRDKGDPDLILYSTLGLLGEILLDSDVRSLLGTLSWSTVPSTLEDWVCDDVYWTGTDKWFTEYAATIYTPEDAVLPSIHNRFSGFVTPFGDFEFSQQPGRDWLVSGDNRPTREKFKNYMFWVLISSYRSGFNPFLERVNRYVFGNKFEAALSRAETLPDNARVLLNPRIKAQFKLEDYYGSDETYVGKAELNYIFGTLLMAKGIFEYLSVYDWTIDLRPWLMTQIVVNDGLDSILDKMFSLQESDAAHKSYWKDPATVAKILPLKNKFLQVRDTRAMDRAKSSITGALTMLNASMNIWFSSDTAPTSQFILAARNSHQWAWEGLAQAKGAINGGVFYFPGRLPTKTEAAGGGVSWPGADASNTVYGATVYGINTAKFFTPGIFTLGNLFTTELGGKAPSLFKVEWYEDRSVYSRPPVFTGGYSAVSEPIEGTGYEANVGGTENNAPYGIYSFGVNTKNLKEIFPQGFDQFGDTGLFYQVFPTIPLWPWETTYFTGLRKPAKKLYEFYHKITVDK